MLLWARGLCLDMIEVRESTAGGGRGVFATRRVREGEVLVRALPFAAVPGDAFVLTHCCICLHIQSQAALN